MNDKTIQELLPWYVNNSLSDTEREKVEQGLTSDESLKQDQQFLNALRQSIKNETRDSPGEFGLQRLRREIKKQPKNKASKKWRVFSIAASLLLVIQLGVILSLTQNDEAFVPLSGSRYADNVIQIQFNEWTTVSQINTFLLEINAVFIDGPSKKGIYRISVPALNDNKLEAIRKQKNIVDFVAEE